MKTINIPFDPNIISNIVSDDIDRLIKDIQEDMVVELKQKTPVDTGTAQAGWEIQGKNIINDVPYIGYLETGTEHTRPVGMLATTLLNIDNIVSKNL